MIRPTVLISTGCVLLACTTAAPGGPLADANPQELGRVRWGRSLDEALETAAGAGKPVLVLFQEIPGCQTCKDFGHFPMSHPLLVEAIETEFIPVAIYNNRPGRDAEVLKRYDEPSWNYPVMRFLDADGADILLRRDRLWNTGAVAARLVEALEASGRDVPGYLRLASAETAPRATERATFSMHCYWEGEARLGALDGVLGTRAGWIRDKEVVEVVYDAAILGAEELASRARRLQCAPIDGPMRDAKSSDQKYALRKSPLRYLPLTPMQATKINADLRRGQDPIRWLSPRQRELAAKIEQRLQADPESLAGLERPGSLEALGAYQDLLRARLEATSS